MSSASGNGRQRGRRRLVVSSLGLAQKVRQDREKAAGERLERWERAAELLGTQSRNRAWRDRSEGYQCPLCIFFWAHSYDAVRFLRRHQ